LDGKEQNEVLWSFDAIQLWREWFAPRYGELKELRHRSNPDDPPDLDVVFEIGEVGFEHTALKPYPLAYAEAIASEINPRGSRILPGISLKWTREKLEKLSSGCSCGVSAWSHIDEDQNVAFRNLTATLKRKLYDSASDVICVRDELPFREADFQQLAVCLDQVLNTEGFGHSAGRVFILIRPDKSLSAVLQRGQPMQVKRYAEPIGQGT